MLHMLRDGGLGFRASCCAAAGGNMYIEIRATQVLVPKFARRGSPGGLGSPPEWH